MGLKTEEGEFNILAQLLSDNSHFPLRVSIFDGETKGSNLFSVREFGNDCLLYSLDELLRYGDVLNLIQTDKHTAGIGFHRLVHIFTDIGKFQNRIQLLINLLLAESNHGAIQINIFNAVILHIEAGTEL